MNHRTQSAPAGPIEINAHAPIILSAEIEIDAPPELVWEVLSAIESWPSWNPEVKEATLDGDLAAGTLFRWKAGPSSLTSTLATVDRPSRIAWTGQSLGLSAIHVYNLEPRDGHTLVRTAESVQGIPARLLRGTLKKRMGTATDLGLQALKTETEQRVADLSSLLGSAR